MSPRHLWLAVGAMASMHAEAALPAELVEYSCALLPRDHQEASATPHQIAVATLASSDPVNFPADISPTTHFVTCARSMLVPSLNDAKVISAGYQMFVGASGEGEEPRAAVYIGDVNSLEFAIVSGEQNDEEKRLTATILKSIHTGSSKQAVKDARPKLR